MFSIRVHQPDTYGHTMYEGLEYEVKPRDGGVTVLLKKKDGTTQSVSINQGGRAYVMGDSGKTVEVLEPGAPRTAQMRGGR